MKDATSYAGSVNPPRRAKRPRSDSIPSPQPLPIAGPTQPIQKPRPQLLPKDPMPPRDPPAYDHDSSADEEDDYNPSTAPAPKRRGRKPGGLSRSARESQRKLNHSRIEKARRTKINETLATLSNLVNDAERRKSGTGAPVVAEPEPKGKSNEKEFKLDVLVKAVTYMEELIDRVKYLESDRAACSHCSKSGPMTSPAGSSLGKRKRAVGSFDPDADVSAIGDGEDYIGDDEKADGHDMDEDMDDHHRPPPSRLSSVHPSPRLPPIASWLPHPYLDPSCIPTMSDNGGAQARHTQPHTSHLPSPPLSGTIRAASGMSTQTLPSLSLPGPARPSAHSDTRVIVASGPHNQGMSIVMPLRRGSTSKSYGFPQSPSVSPTWTPEDETAASLLLQMSSSPPSSVSSTSSAIAALKLPKQGVPAVIRERGSSSSSKHTIPLQVQTPSSLLGM